MKFILVALTYFLEPGSAEVLWKDTFITSSPTECEKLGERYKQLVESADKQFEVRYECFAYVEGPEVDGSR